MYAHERETVFFFEMVTVVYGGNVQRSATKQLARERRYTSLQGTVRVCTVTGEQRCVHTRERDGASLWVSK